MIRKFEKTPGQNVGKSVRVGENTGKENLGPYFAFVSTGSKKPRQGRQRRTPPGQKAKAIPHNSRLTAQAPLRRLRHGICVAKMLDNTQSIICAFGLAAAVPRSPYRHLELCGIALI